ncbi:MAG: amidase [Deltaproteobacteria bacterium]|nr:amidase [Deltaproteobacteria bacterium]
MSDLAYDSAVDLARKIRRREVSSREALEYFLARIARLDRTINSVVTIDADRARAEAIADDEALARGEVRGPLHGVPMTIKDSFQTAGMRTTSGAPELADFVPREDAWPVARLREAGAVIFGKTNLPIYAGDLQSYNEVFGTTNNPYDPTRTPGGSSGGSAAALACGFTPLELGSDIGGSIRLPAHMSGVVGHKPSYGIVPAHGQIPGPPGTLTLADLAVVGPLARTVEDLELALGLLAGPNRWEQPAWRLELPPPRRRTLAEYRIAAWLDDPRCRVEPEVGALLESAARALADAGARVDPQARPEFSLEKVADTFFALLQAALAGGTSRDRIEAYAASTGDAPLASTRRLVAMRHREWLSHNERRLQLRRSWEAFFQRWDVVLLPVMPCPAIPHDQTEPQAARLARVGGEQRPYWDLVTWMAPAGACYLPATVVPVGRLSNGLPVGIQVAGPYLHDRTTLDVAKHLLGRIGGCPRPAGF